MNNWFLPFMLATAFGPSMLAIGMRVGRQRTVATLAQLLEQGAFRLVSADGTPVGVKELSGVLGADLGRPKTAPGHLIAIALAAACLGALLALLIVRSGH